jgi:hypothetical protein
MAVQNVMASGNSTNVVALLDRWFYFGMSLLIAIIAMYGFGQTIDRNLIHPTIPRPFILYVHAPLFVAWVGVFIAQTSLVRSRNMRWHRRLGISAAVLGIFMVGSGIAVAIAMRKFDIANHLSKKPEFLSIPFSDMIVFAVLLALAVHWRRKPEIHRRLMLVATCALLDAALTRFPPAHPFWMTYVGVDLIISFGLLRDLVVLRRVNPVYLYGLPALVAAQAVAILLYVYPPQWWSAVCQALVT